MTRPPEIRRVRVHMQGRAVTSAISRSARAGRPMDGLVLLLSVIEVVDLLVLSGEVRAT